ncbi:SUF system NifU family Fe-S cluster assembly protein [Clostridium tertium]|uniref:Fe-S cluster assembly sulfur transfer protein SufU n=1 Tax=Clostridium TaxID=1485 RepID=UPI00115760FE|nr:MULTISPECIES: SUF system NifU family Fe-S cluster assembly protein [Clostridium]MBS5308010.1 SUF system NifU family Fe-S cluster assembly protein [Clostridium sp.]MBS6501319.1 SUF system NifU family Fe-S cluster assembly protein [Clostridium sp.]MCR1951698.1 SUF system NifU family Fe-S cluster assembly protein [Clostridium sp. DSM 100503]MDB1921359.1 SUF system NifU family Fe-S cluster assembly protein [Clostridium tertium]MDB1924604.1 SUF system NifU family Fe-S cluster assembly protein [C
MDLNAIYTELIMEHSTSRHNRRKLDNPDLSEKGHNPSCGDEITLELKMNGDIIEDLAFTGQGCAISQASTSMMIDLIKGKDKEEALKLVETFIGMIKREINDEDELEALEDAIVLKNISNMPARVKCAVLAWHTLKEAISEEN